MMTDQQRPGACHWLRHDGDGCRTSHRWREAAGIEPSPHFAASNSIVWDRENCQGCHAARALHFECFKSHFLASLDADLQGLIDRWEHLDATARHAIADQMTQENLR